MKYGICRCNNSQLVTIQELPEITPPGQKPHSVGVILEDDAVGRFKPGDRVRILGVFKAVPGGTFKAVPGGMFRAQALGMSVDELFSSASSNDALRMVSCLQHLRRWWQARFATLECVVGRLELLPMPPHVDINRSVGHAYTALTDLARQLDAYHFPQALIRTVVQVLLSDGMGGREGWRTFVLRRVENIRAPSQPRG